MLSFDDFLKVDIRVGRVVRAETFPQARKPAYKLTIDFGAEIGTKRSSAQLTTHYSPAELDSGTVPLPGFGDSPRLGFGDSPRFGFGDSPHFGHFGFGDSPHPVIQRIQRIRGQSPFRVLSRCGHGAQMLSFDDFLKVDIRVGRVMRAETFPQARKPAYKLTIDFGAEIGTKRSSAQLTTHYSPAELEGRLVLAVVNLAPRQIGPFVSEVLTLGVPDVDGAVVLLRPDLEAPVGGRMF